MYFSFMVEKNRLCVFKLTGTHLCFFIKGERKNVVKIMKRTNKQREFDLLFIFQQYQTLHGFFVSQTAGKNACK